METKSKQMNSQMSQWTDEMRWGEPVAKWLREQFNHVLAEEQAEMAKQGQNPINYGHN